MIRKIVIIILIVFSTMGIHAEEVSSHEQLQTIPDDAIRLRILANSDSEEDQHIKRMVRDDVNRYITDIVQEIATIEEARATIAAHIPQIDEIVKNTLERLNVSEEFTVEYNSNVTFPMKVYDTYVYPPGEYEAVLISIGEGKGSNWWCVLFPPLCFLDFSNGSTVLETEEERATDVDEVFVKEQVEEEEEDEEEEVEVRFFLFEWLGLT